MSLLAALRARADAGAGQTVLIDSAGSLSASELWRDVQIHAAQLQARGVRRLASQLDNGRDAVLVDLACRLARVVHVPLPGFFTPAQRQHALRDAGIDALALPPSMAAEVLGPGLGLRRIDAGAVSLPDGTALITYTSGSTGAPKGVCLASEHLDAVARALLTAMNGAPPQRHLCLLPLAVLLESVAGVYAGLHAGATLLLPGLQSLGWRGGADIDGARLATAIAQWQPESLILVPQLLHAWMDALTQGAPRAQGLRFCAIGGAKVHPELLLQAWDLGLPVHEGYGLSECASVVCLNRPGVAHPGTVGTPLPHLRLSLAADGEILLDGPRFLGYVGAVPPAPGPFATGDIGEIDAEGRVRIVGRKRNLYINAYGRNIAPEWVECELAQEGAIAQAFVDGEGSAWNLAVLVPSAQPDAAPAIAAAVTRANARLPDYAQVHAYLIAEQAFSVDSGELTANGRLRRNAIQARYRPALQALGAQLAGRSATSSSPTGLTA